jgi:hypothetical protein
MSRGSRRFVVLLSLTLVLLVVAATALADKPVPTDGRFHGYASQGSQRPFPAYFTVSKSGRAVSLEITALGLACEINGSAGFPIGVHLSSKNLKPTGKADPLAIVKGKFSYNGPIYNVLSITGTGKISGTFKSPTKLVGSARFSWPSSSLAPGLEGPCDSGKLTFSATHE